MVAKQNVVLLFTVFNVCLAIFIPYSPPCNECIKKAMAQHGVVPDVLDEPVPSVLIVKFGDFDANEGYELTPIEVKAKPTIEWREEVAASGYYSLIMIDPDVPSRENPSVRSFVNWMLVNIKGKNFDCGDTLFEYVGAAPCVKSGLHRYILLLFMHPKGEKIQFNESNVKNTELEPRLKFNLKEFAKKYNLGQPVAGNFFTAKYDDYVPTLKAQLGVQN